MPEGSERYVYAGVGLVAVVAGAFAWASWSADAPTAADHPAPRRQPAASETASSSERATGGVEIVEPPEAGAPRVDDDFVPDLPEVPDLATEPPPPPPPEDEDPRFAQLGAEMRFLSRARELLTEHPSEALGVLERHRRDYPHGVLSEEREAYAIEALLALEHVDEAERRYYELRDDYPESAFVARLEEMMQRPPHEVGAGGR